MTIGQQVTSSLRWMTGMRIAGQVFTWGSTLFVIRLLSPEDYGLMAMATVVIGFLANTNEMGLASAIIQKKELDKVLVSKIFGMLLLFDAFLFGIIYFIAPFVADFFGDDRLISIIRVLGITILVNPLFTIPDAIMTRNMEFRSISIIAFCGQIVAAITTLSFAFYGVGVWALVYGQLTLAAAVTVGAFYASRYFCLPSFNFTGVRGVLNFGGFITLQCMLYSLFVKADEIIIGKFLGKEILGFYAVAMRLATLPMEKFQAILNEIGFSAFSQIQENREKVQQHLCKAVRILAVIVFPVFFGISSVAPELVAVLLGEKWLTTILPLQILSIAMALRMMNITDPVLNALGRPDAGAKVFAIGCIVMPAAFLVGIKWGLIGVCYAWLIAYPIHFLITMRISLPIIGLTLGRYVGQFIAPAIMAAVMYAAVVFAKHTVAVYISNPIFELAALISIGGLTYSILLFLFYRSVIEDLISLVRR